MGTIFEAVGSTEFLAGLRWGLITGAVALLVRLAWRRWQKSLFPVAGVVIATAIYSAMSVARPVPAVLVLGLVLLTIGGLISTLIGGRPWWGMALAAPGAHLVAFRSGIPGARWVPWLVLAVIVVGSGTGEHFDRRYRTTGLTAVLLAVTLAGAFLTLPDTEEILVMLGAALPVLILVWPRPMVAMGFGIFPVIGILMWAVAWGGRGREGSIVGAAAGLGVLLVEPMAARGKGPFNGWGLTSVHIGIVLVAARIAGLKEGPVTAAAISTAALLAGLFACWMLTRGYREYAPRRIDGPHLRS